MDWLTEFLQSHFENPWISGGIEAGAIIIFFTGLLGPGMKWLRPALKALLSKLLQGTPNERVIDGSLRLVKNLFVLLAANLVLSSLPLPEKAETWFYNTVFVITCLFVLLSLFDLTNVISQLIGARAAEFEILINRVFKILVATVTLMIGMRHFNYDIWHLMTALGVGTLAVGLAAQPTLSNMIAGFTILIDRPFRRGDRIALSGSEPGDVVGIGMRSTHILMTDGNMLIVSNSELVNTRVINYSFPNNHIIQKAKLYVEHGSPLQKIKAQLRGACEKIDGIVKDSVTVFITSINDWGVEITVFFKVQNFTETTKISDAVIDMAILEIHQLGVKLATSPIQPKS